MDNLNLIFDRLKQVIQGLHLIETVEKTDSLNTVYYRFKQKKTDKIFEFAISKESIKDINSEEYEVNKYDIEFTIHTNKNNLITAWKTEIELPKPKTTIKFIE